MSLVMSYQISQHHYYLKKLVPALVENGASPPKVVASTFSTSVNQPIFVVVNTVNTHRGRHHDVQYTVDCLDILNRETVIGRKLLPHKIEVALFGQIAMT